jgi:two-component system sensor histidine kinase KdpD
MFGSELDQLGERTTGRSFEIDIAWGIPLVSLVFVLINQVLVNILDNALKYSEEDIDIFASQNEQEIVIDICDRGKTIPENERTQIFEKFYQLQADTPSSGGSGLGLAISKGILEAHGASISIEARAPKGNCFRIHVPMVIG